jgi:hypothetical protein
VVAVSLARRCGKPCSQEPPGNCDTYFRLLAPPLASWRGCDPHRDPGSCMQKKAMKPQDKVNKLCQTYGEGVYADITAEAPLCR